LAVGPYSQRHRSLTTAPTVCRNLSRAPHLNLHQTNSNVSSNPNLHRARIYRARWSGRVTIYRTKTNAKANQSSAAARKPVSEYSLARLGSPNPSRSHIGRRGAPHRISAVDCWRNRMARAKPRRTDDPPPVRLRAERPTHPPGLPRRKRGAHAGVRPALVANGRRFIARDPASAVSLQPIGSD